MAANLHVLHEPPARPQETLRALADAIERGDHGAVHGLVLVCDAEFGLDVTYSGPGEAATNAHFLLHAGAAKMMSAVMRDKDC